MRTTLCTVFLAMSAAAGEPSIIFDSRPESGVPVDAMLQKPLDTRNHYHGTHPAGNRSMARTKAGP